MMLKNGIKNIMMKKSQKEKDELAIKCGKRITKELLHNTDDRANLIAKMLEEEE